MYACDEIKHRKHLIFIGRVHCWCNHRLSIWYSILALFLYQQIATKSCSRCLCNVFYLHLGPRALASTDHSIKPKCRWRRCRQVVDWFEARWRVFAFDDAMMKIQSSEWRVASRHRRSPRAVSGNLLPSTRTVVLYSTWENRAKLSNYALSCSVDDSHVKRGKWQS